MKKNNKNIRIPHEAIVIKRALAKIKVNIWYIYENLRVGKEIKEARAKFCIPDNFFEDYKVNNHSDNVNILLGHSIMTWGHKILNNKNILDQVIKNLGKKKFEIAKKKITDERIKKDTKWNYAINKIENYIGQNDNEDVYSPMRLNPIIWRLVVGAKLFEIPQKTVFKCMMSLLKNYFPTVDSSLRIQINELTSIEDIKHIWPEVEKRQRMFTGDHRIKGKQEYPNHDRDKIAYELREYQQMTGNQIKKELKKQGFGSYTYSYIPRIIKTYKEFIEKI